MKALFFNTKRIRIVETERSTRPTGIGIVSEHNKRVQLNDVAVCFVCVERGDSEHDAEKIVEETEKYFVLVGRRVLLVPFVHLSSDTAEPHDARHWIEYIREKLHEKGLLAGTTAFGWHKKMEIQRWVTNAHKGDVAFRDSRRPERVETLHQTSRHDRNNGGRT